MPRTILGGGGVRSVPTISSASCSDRTYRLLRALYALPGITTPSAKTWGQGTGVFDCMTPAGSNVLMRFQ